MPDVDLVLKAKSDDGVDPVESAIWLQCFLGQIGRSDWPKLAKFNLLGLVLPACRNLRHEKMAVHVIDGDAGVDVVRGFADNARRRVVGDPEHQERSGAAP